MKLYFSVILGLLSLFQQPVSQFQSEIDENNIVTEVDRELIVKLVNEFRRSGIKSYTCESETPEPLVWNTELAHIASVHCMDMYQNNLSGHFGSDGSNPGERLKKYGYKHNAAGENVAVGDYTESEIISAWMRSPGHRKNILDARFHKIGVARVGKYWTMLLSN
ncbi:MAG: CAP domain-containing protein [Lentimicrobiaceae bacterium]|nr:CAP domain-containing protein [Lentimicrobiaceae bacterium]